MPTLSKPLDTFEDLLKNFCEYAFYSPLNKVGETHTKYCIFSDREIIQEIFDAQDEVGFTNNRTQIFSDLLPFKSSKFQKIYMKKRCMYNIYFIKI